MGKIFCVEFQREPFKLYCKYFGKIDLVMIELDCNGDYQKWTSQWPIECFARMELVIDLILFSTTRPTVAFSKSAQLENDSQSPVNTLKQRPNGQYFADKIFKCILLNENHYIYTEI